MPSFVSGARSAILGAVLAMALAPVHAAAQDLDAAEQAHARNDGESVIGLLLPVWNRGQLKDPRALYLLSRACMGQKPSLRFALNQAAQCNNRTGRITWAAADAGNVDAMLDLAVTLDTDLAPLRHPDLRQDRAFAFRAALLARNFASTPDQRERAEKAIAEVGRRLSAPVRDRVEAEVAAVVVPVTATAAGSPVASGEPPRPGTEGPFGLRFDMSMDEVALKAVESDKYGRDSLSSPNKYYSCLETMTWPYNGSYDTTHLSDAQRAQHLAMRQRWRDALAHTDPQAVELADTLRMRASERLGVIFQGADAGLTDVDVRAYVTGSGTTLCTAFFQDRLFRVTANLSGKRDLIAPLLEKVKADYAGAFYEYWPSRGESSRVYTHRWAGHPEGMWVTIHHEDYERPKNVDMSRAYAFGGSPDFPTPAQRPAEADYVYPPILAEALVWHGRRKARDADAQQEQQQKRRREALEEF